MDINLVVATMALSTVFLALFVDMLQTRAIRCINRRFEAESKAFEERGSIGEQFGDWLLAKEKLEDGTEITNLESCSRLVGKQIAGSFSMGLKGIASGESRTIKSVEKAVLEGLETPETKALLEACDRFGIGRELAGTVYQVLEKYGKLPNILKNNGGSGEKSSW